MSKSDLGSARHVLIVLPAGDDIAQVPLASALDAALKRRNKKPEALRKSAVTLEVDLLTPIVLGKNLALTVQVLRGGIP